jgi:hypothetical protein
MSIEKIQVLLDPGIIDEMLLVLAAKDEGYTFSQLYVQRHRESSNSEAVRVFMYMRMALRLPDNGKNF